MNPRICICCGEPMDEKGNTLSRNPNICASCSSLADGMSEKGLEAVAGDFQPESPTASLSPKAKKKASPRRSAE